MDLSSNQDISNLIKSFDASKKESSSSVSWNLLGWLAGMVLGEEA